MDKITLAHGSGGIMMHKLIDSLFIGGFDNSFIRQKKDSAILNIGASNAAFTTDSYVVNPIFFPGGDIGSLAVWGTVNDLAVCGARPMYVSLAIIAEEGLEIDTLKSITASAKRAADLSGVKIVTGDTKVVEHGHCDKIFINTSGIGEIYYDKLSIGRIKPGDKVIISGTIGEHAISVLSKREGIEFQSKVKSDSAPLASLIEKTVSAADVKFMRDPTRGGVATTLNEITAGRKFGIMIDENMVPVSRSVKSACELLGFDPLYLACEGRVIFIVSEADANKALKVIRKDKNGKSAKIAGEITQENKGRVVARTGSGGKRLVEMLSGEQLPRIC